MLRPAPTLIALAAALAASATAANAEGPATEPEFRAHVERLVEEGQIGFDQGLLLQMQRVFSPSDLPSDLRSASPWPYKSATILIHEYEELRAGFSSELTATIDGMLVLPAATSSYETDHFRFEYETTGTDGVSPVDVDPANGVPDFVERVGEYAELSWARLFDQAGFTPPILDAGRYPIAFREMAAYGYTYRTGEHTAIVLHHDFVGFPQNDDPDGSRLGATKVTIAHELKHASQHASSDWTEGGWLEADATWAEDFVFDATNDYLRYLPFGSPVSDPGNWLPSGNASYEDCLWAELLESVHGVSALVDFFARRSAHPFESVLTTYDEVLRSRNASLASTCDLLGVWSYFCGANAASRPVGFDEAELFPTPPFANTFAGDESAISATLPGMSTHYLLATPNERTGHPIVSFAGDRQRPLSAHVTALTRTGLRPTWTLSLSASNTGAFEVPFAWDDIAFLVVGVTNLGTPGSTSSYVAGVGDPNAVGVNGLAGTGTLSLEPNRPNPFRSTTAITFSIPTADHVRLAVYDVAGRLVRRLVDEDRMPAGTHERDWNGFDESGRASAPGVYYYRLQTSSDSATRKMLLLR